MISALVVAAIMLVAASLEASAHSLRRDADALTEIALDLGRAALSLILAPLRLRAPQNLGSPGSPAREGSSRPTCCAPEFETTAWLGVVRLRTQKCRRKLSP